MRLYLNGKEVQIVKDALRHYYFDHCEYDSMEREVLSVVQDRIRLCEELQISERTQVIKSKRP